MKKSEAQKQIEKFYITLGRHHYLKMNKTGKLELYNNSNELLGEFNNIAQANWYLILNNLL